MTEYKVKNVGEEQLRIEKDGQPIAWVSTTFPAGEFATDLEWALKQVARAEDAIAEWTKERTADPIDEIENEWNALPHNAKADGAYIAGLKEVRDRKRAVLKSPDQLEIESQQETEQMEEQVERHRHHAHGLLAPYLRDQFNEWLNDQRVEGVHPDGMFFGVNEDGTKLAAAYLTDTDWMPRDKGDQREDADIDGLSDAVFNRMVDNGTLDPFTGELT